MWFSLFAIAAASIQSLQFAQPYLNHDYHNENYEFGGTSVLSKSGLELTSDSAGLRGWMVSRNAVLPDDFQLDIDFILQGAARTLFGDGLAIWFLEGSQSLQEGPVFGVQDKLAGTALVIDTYRNHRPGKAFPLLVLSQNDGTRKYDIDNDGLANELASASLRGLYNAHQKPSKIRIVGHKGGNIVVSLNYRGDKWETHIDQPLNFNGARRLALSASTGQLSSAHIVQKIEVKQLSPLSFQEQQHYEQEQLKHHNSNGSPKRGFFRRVFSFLFKLTMVAAAVIGGLKMYKHYKRNQRSSYLP